MMGKSVIEMGAYVGDGWQQILHELDEELRTVAPEYDALQVKEKFGLLRVYIHTGNSAAFDAAQKIVSKYESLSATVCESCGADGRLRDGGWVLTLCDTCAVKRGME
jgi:Fe2+ or Zn2+ uptake regulation protein